MKKYILSNLGLKLISVFIAFLIWLMVVNGDDPESIKSYRVPIEVTNAKSVLEAGRVYKTTSEDIATVYIRARKSVHQQIDAANIGVIADFENIVSFEMPSIPLQVNLPEKLNIPRENIIRCEPSSLKVEIEDIQDEEFRVTVSPEGRPGSGYEVGETQVLEGPNIRISGPASDIAIINRVVVPIDVSGMVTDDIITEAITIYDGNEQPFTDTQLNNLDIKTTEGVGLKDREVQVKVSLWPIQSEIKLDVELTGEAAEGYILDKVTTTPSTLSLVGKADVLAALAGELEIKNKVSIDGKSASFEETINLTEYLREIYDRDLRQVAEADEEITVNVQLRKRETTTVYVPVADIAVLNAPPGLTLTLTPADRIAIDLQGENEEVEISPGDVKVTLDLKDYQQAMNGKVPLKVEIQREGFTLAPGFTAEITINLEQTESETLTGMGGEG